MAVLDTSFLIDLDRGHEAAVDVLHALQDSAVPLMVPAHAAMEYASGFEDAVAALHNLEASFTFVPLTREHVLEGARIGRSAFADGIFPGWSDVAIAAVAILEDAPVVTANPRHFEALGCTVWDHRDGAGAA